MKIGFETLRAYPKVILFESNSTFHILTYDLDNV